MLRTSWHEVQDAVDSVDNALASVLREGASAASQLGMWSAESIVSAAEKHGVQGLVRRSLSGAEVSSDVKTLLDACAFDEMVHGVERRDQTKRVLDALHGAGFAVIVLKGAAIAHTLYPAPYLRPHSDTDLLIRQSDFNRACDLLRSIGYRPINMVSRDLVHTQRAFERTDANAGTVHAVDLHWAISCRPLFAGMLSLDELARVVVPVSGLGEHAVTPAPVWALLLACIHRVAHHGDSRRLIWLYDIKLLAETLSAAEWELFWQLAASKNILSVCRRSVELAAQELGCSALALRAIAQFATTPGRKEPSAAYLGEGITTQRMLTLDLTTAGGYAAKVRLVASHAFPDAAYMRAEFGATTRTALLVAYVRRLIVGARRYAALRVVGTTPISR